MIGCVNAKRGQMRSMDDIGGGKIVRALVPLAEMFGYSTELRASCQGRGNCSMFFEKYEPVPKNVQDKVLADRSKESDKKCLKISAVSNIMRNSRVPSKKIFCLKL